MSPRSRDEDAVLEEADQSTKTKGEPSSTPSDAQASDQKPQRAWPETQGSAFERWFKSSTFSYMRPLLRKGRRQILDGSHLTQVDLFAVPDTMQAKELVATFHMLYAAENRNLLKTLWKLAAPTFIPAGFMQLFYMAGRIALPLAMRQLLIALENNPNQSVVREGLPYAIIIFVAAVTAAFGQHREAHLATKSGIILRAALISVIYEHALRLSPAGQAGLTTGEVTNLVATDTQKLFEVTLEGHLVWSCPMFIVIVTGLLWWVMGPEMIVGIVILIGFVPVVKKIVNKMLVIRKKRAKLADQRINIITAMLQGIQVTKLNHYESKVLDRVDAVRQQEIKLLRSELFMWGWTMVCAVSSPMIATAASFSFYALVRDGNVITPSSAFSVLLLFSILRFPINLGARLVGKLAQALDSAKRISDFLQRDTQPIKQDVRDVASKDQPLVQLVDATFETAGDTKQASMLPESGETSMGEGTFAVQDINVTVEPSQICAVAGAVGSGKSVLLQGLLGEIQATEGSQVISSGKIGYAAQVPFILNATLRDNILFGLPLDKEHYNKVLIACSLEQDIQRFPGGDLTQIGERGVTLSGGQKQRVSLARVLYARPDIALLDDVFSALDAGTADSVYKGLFGPDGLLKSQATILVTHATKFLQNMDNILVLSKGKPVFSGPFSELQESEGHLAVEALNQDNANSSGEAAGNVGAGRMDGGKGGHVDGEETIIMTKEEREFGLSQFKTWLVWFYYAGGWTYLVGQLVFLFLDRFLYVGSEWWLSQWTEASDESISVFAQEWPPQTEGRHVQLQYIGVYFLILTFSVAATALRSHWGVQGGARCAEMLFGVMTKSVLGAPLSYFQTTPLGRILNRFTYDIEVLDIELSVSMSGLFISFSWFAASLAVMLSVLPWIICALVPVIGVYLVLQRYHRQTGPDLQRLDAMSRSPLQAQLAEALDGVETIRAFQKQTFFVDTFHSSVDKNSSAMLNFDAAQRWLALRIEILGSLITLSACSMVVFGNGVLNLPSGLVGFLVIWSIVFTTVSAPIGSWVGPNATSLNLVVKSLGFLLQRFTETEAKITAIERVQSTSELPQEASWETDKLVKLDCSWPSMGELVFKDVCLRYRQGLPLALDSVSFTLPPGTRCGVVGRTGSGKSTLTVALFRLVEIESGSITLDGVDLSNLGLADVRGRKNGLRIIPQDPVLFAGHLRDCLDPFGTETDEALLDALKAVNHVGWERGVSVLSDLVDEGGANYSVGERQLLCLARAIVEEPRVLVMDEASASLDNESDKRIQRMLRERFKNTTMLTIAHRLDTILDYDMILFMEDGRVAEFAPPQDLLSKPDGLFASLVGRSLSSQDRNDIGSFHHLSWRSTDTPQELLLRHPTAVEPIPLSSSPSTVASN